VTTLDPVPTSNNREERGLFRRPQNPAPRRTGPIESSEEAITIGSWKFFALCGSEVASATLASGLGFTSGLGFDNLFRHICAFTS
jgi:hypothetical protein